MQQSDRQEFEKQIGVLFAAIDKPLTEPRTEAFWQGCSSMSLLDLGRTINHVLSEMRDGAAPKYFSVADLWAAKKRLRATAPPAATSSAPAQAHFDGWARAGNFHLFAHIRKTLGRGSRRYGFGGNYVGGIQESQEFRDNVHRLVTAKNGWVEDMRDLAGHNGGEVSPVQQREIWNDYINRAEAEIAAARTQAA